MNEKRFLSAFFLTLFIVLSTVFILNGIVDPYDLFRSSLSPIQRHHKTEINSHLRLTKAMDIQVKRPKGVLLGSSRVLEGIDSHDATQIAGVECYNCGLSGVNMEEIRAYFEYSLKMQPQLKTVIIGLDLFAFNAYCPGRPDYHKDRLCTPSFPFRDYLIALLSYEALRSSFRTWKHCKNLDAHILIDGDGNLLSGQIDKYYAAKALPFLARERKMLNSFFKDPKIYGQFQLSVQALEDFKEIVKTCDERGITLKVFVSPAHAIYWQGLWEKQLWKTFEELKRQIAFHTPFWDFSGVNQISTEPFEDSSVSFFYDSGHFRPSLGKILLEKIFKEEPLREGFLDFGTLVDFDNINEHLEKQRNQQIAWKKEHPHLVKFLNE